MKKSKTVWKISEWELSSRGDEQIVSIKTFDNVLEMREYVANIKAEIKPYKMERKKKYYTQEASDCYVS